MTTPTSTYPMHGYLYNPDGTHGPPTILNNQEELFSFIRLYGTVAIEHLLELRLTSGDDDDLYLHIEQGKVLYASGVDPGTYTRAILGEPPYGHGMSPVTTE